MCIVFYTQSQPGFRLILAANRDEYLDRPALPAEWHNFDKPQDDNTFVWSGRDLGSADKGTWLGITRDLRVGILTNIRFPLTPTPLDAPSRGLLLKEYLENPPNSVRLKTYIEKIQPERYPGFNLLLFHLHELKSMDEVGYLSNRPEPTLLYPNTSGYIGLSNSPLASPFPKVIHGEQQMEASLLEWVARNEDDDQLVERMMELLSSPAPEILSLADTTNATRIRPLLVGSDPNIPTSADQDGLRWYGTRVSTVILVRDNGESLVVERDRAVLVDGYAQESTAERRARFSAELS